MVSDLVCTEVEQGSHVGEIRGDSVVLEHPKGDTGGPNEDSHHEKVLHVLAPDMEYPKKAGDQVPEEDMSGGNQELMGDTVTLQQQVPTTRSSSGIHDQILARGGG
jgi:hypothetical protein